MKTRRSGCYYSSHAAAPPAPGEGPEVHRRKRRRRMTAAEASPAAAASDAGGVCLARNMFDELPDDLVISILRDVAASAGSPADLAGAMLTCKRFRELGVSKAVLARASPRCLAVRAQSWSDEAHRFLQRCTDAGNLEACYLLGMIRFYCLGSRGSGAALMAAAAAAAGGHREALYSLAVIQFNGSGGGKGDRDLRAGAALCARAASLGHVGALRELGHCLLDGYGVRRSVLDGRRLLVHANALEHLATTTASTTTLLRSCLMSEFGCGAGARGEAHAANRFLVDWFAARPLAGTALARPGGNGNGNSNDIPRRNVAASTEEEDGGAALRLCSQERCGRPETRRHEFRRCSVCGAVNYCSRACQAMHWKVAHKAECTPMNRWWLDANADAAAAAAALQAP